MHGINTIMGKNYGASTDQSCYHKKHLHCHVLQCITLLGCSMTVEDHLQLEDTYSLSLLLSHTPISQCSRPQDCTHTNLLPKRSCSHCQQVVTSHKGYHPNCCLCRALDPNWPTHLHRQTLGRCDWWYWITGCNSCWLHAVAHLSLLWDQLYSSFA